VRQETATVTATIGQPSSANTFANPDGARTINTDLTTLPAFDPTNPPGSGSPVAGAALSTQSVSTLNFSKFEDVPRGAKITSVAVRVRHVMVNGSSSVSLTTKDLSGTVVPVGATRTLSDTCTSYSYGCLLKIQTSDFPAGPLWKSFNDLALTYTANGPTATGAVGSDVVDGIELVVNYDLPGLLPQSCASPCQYFFASGNNPNVYVRGTVYTPTASWYVEVHNSGDTMFNRGVIVRDLAVNMNASSKQEGAPFRLDRGGRGRRVLFRGWTPDQNPSSDPPRLRACVDYTDTAPTGNTTIAYYGWSLTVLKWAPTRVPVDGELCDNLP
jgi:hypothetical protein